MVSRSSRRETFERARRLVIARSNVALGGSYYFRSDKLIVQYKEEADVIIIYDLDQTPTGVYSNKRKYNRTGQFEIPDSVVKHLLRESVLDELANV